MASMEVMDPIASGADGAIPSPKISQKEMRQEGLMQLSDAEGFAQLLFHLSFLAMCAMLATWAYDHGYWAVLLAAEIPLGIGESFLFNGFHEMVHNTAFETRFLNTCFAHLLGFECFRGAKWFWCFHWTHHRFTNDPSKDPELSGESVDLDDPTKSLSGYLQFISGYPFGFERVVRMARTVCYNEVDPWVVDKPETTQRVVRMEAACYLFGYSCVFLVSLLRPSIGIKVVLLWILPHCIGAGHLRLYQFAEHRACKMGPYTDTWCFRETSFLFCVFSFSPKPKKFSGGFWRLRVFILVPNQGHQCLDLCKDHFHLVAVQKVGLVHALPCRAPCLAKCTFPQASSCSRACEGHRFMPQL